MTAEIAVKMMLSDAICQRLEGQHRPRITRSVRQAAVIQFCASQYRSAAMCAAFCQGAEHAL
jgi:hypothetical protein